VRLGWVVAVIVRLEYHYCIDARCFKVFEQVVDTVRLLYHSTRRGLDVVYSRGRGCFMATYYDDAREWPQFIFKTTPLTIEAYSPRHRLLRRLYANERLVLEAGPEAEASTRAIVPPPDPQKIPDLLSYAARCTRRVAIVD
jgi:hypothetical protein